MPVGGASRRLVHPAMIGGALLWVSLSSVAGELPGVADPERAETNYMLHCQGCHGPQGEGNARAQVPRMQGFVGNFLKVQGGRAFLVQVPGSANAALSDAALAELLNWMLPTMSASEMPADFVPYHAEEVAGLRRSREADIHTRRTALIEAIRLQGQAIPTAENSL